ncbi:hypothetical protein Tco_1086122 [Tanacetum coccineum]
MIGQDLHKNDTRDSKQTHLLMEFYTEINAKEAHYSKEVGLPAWESVCSHSNPTVTIEDPIIRRNQRPRSKAKRSGIFSLSLTPLCCDDTHEVMPCVFALTGCDRLVSEPMGGEWIIKREMMMISKDGTISKFPEYHSSEEEEPTEQPRSLNKYGFGNTNGWLIEDDDELEKNEADADDEEEEEPMEEEEVKEDSEKKI